MPLYEEKLINPLALRFTQEHIRTTFRDGRPVEPTIGEIEALPGKGDYDVVLRAPFPHIEILRWSPPCYDCRHAESEEAVGSSSGGHEVDKAVTVTSTEEMRSYHWFTLDNRRLYCLQRAALALLPRRAAAVVQILYADPGTVWRKYDSETQGRSVSISHSSRTAPIRRWAWQDEVVPKGVSTVAELFNAQEAVRAMQIDDQKCTVDALQAVAASASGSVAEQLNDALSRAEADYKRNAVEAKKTQALTPSTTDDSSDGELDAAEGASLSVKATLRKRPCQTLAVTQQQQSAATSAAFTPGVVVAAAVAEPEQQAARINENASVGEDALVALRRCLEGVKWIGRRRDSYDLSFVGGACWACKREDNMGSKKFTVSYDAEHCIVWWGIEQAYYFNACDVDARTDHIAWYAASDWDMQKARFVWKLAEPRAALVQQESLAASAIKDSCGREKRARARPVRSEDQWKHGRPT